MQRPVIVCLCGSTRFMDTFVEQAALLTMQGKIVLSVGVGVHSPDNTNLAQPGTLAARKIKAKLDILHLHKIAISDEVLVLNVGGYIGESTEREIEFATSIGVPIQYLESINEVE